MKNESIKQLNKLKTINIILIQIKMNVLLLIELIFNNFIKMKLFYQNEKKY